ncbi:MAG: hypothetical protein WAU68_14890 [Vitreimonas sp.]
MLCISDAWAWVFSKAAYGNRQRELADHLWFSLTTSRDQAALTSWDQHLDMRQVGRIIEDAISASLARRILLAMLIAGCAGVASDGRNVRLSVLADNSSAFQGQVVRTCG